MYSGSSRSCDAHAQPYDAGDVESATFRLDWAGGAGAKRADGGRVAVHAAL